MLAEKGIEHETVVVDLAAAEQLSDAYRALNPACTVPALALPDGTVLTDNAGIAAWAEGFKPDPPLFGVTCLGPSNGFDTTANTSGFIIWLNHTGIMIDPRIEQRIYRYFAETRHVLV